jgi:hypothetical protein
MRSELRIATHAIRDNEQVIEIWYGGEFVGQVVGLDGPGVQVISKYRITAVADDDTSQRATPINALKVFTGGY